MAAVDMVKMSPGGCLDNQEDVARPKVEHQPSLWGDYFIHLPPSFDQESQRRMQRRVEELKMQVLSEILASSSLGEISLTEMCTNIDAIQRLGLAYHFVKETTRALEHILDSKARDPAAEIASNKLDLYTVALRFRLLRQEGYDIDAAEEFKAFVDQDGKFMQSVQSRDVKGLLSLYEAGYMAKHGEGILDEAVKFCRAHLRAWMLEASTTISAVDKASMELQIAHALDIPSFRRFKRIEVREYLAVYERLQDRNELLLELAKLDFNLVQILHQQELKTLSVWWKGLGLPKRLPFARDRLVELYVFVMAAGHEPSLSRARIMGTKVLGVASLLDDTYDSYGTVEELEVFTDHLRRWDSKPSEQLPECLNHYLTTLMKTVDDLEEELARDGHHGRIDFLRQYIYTAAAAYFAEAKWASGGCMPSFGDRLAVALVSALYHTLSGGFLVGMGDVVTIEVLEWHRTFPRIVEAVSTIGRLMNDFKSYKREKNETEIRSSIDSYMKEHGVPFEEACAKLQEMVEDAWRDLNQELLRSHARFPKPVLAVSLGLACVSVTFYKDTDGYTYPSQFIRHHISLLYTEPIPV